MAVFTKVQLKYIKAFDSNLLFLRLLTNNLCDSATSKGNTITLETLDSIDKKHNLEELRNKSKLSPEHRRLLNNEKAYPEPISKYQLTVKYNRRMYGLYGSESGVNPGIMWPTKAEIEERKEYEKIAYPFTIQEMVDAALKEKEMKELDIQRQHEKVILNLSKLETWKQELKTKIAKKEAEALAIQEKKEKMIEAVRRHFGYKVDPRDERFKEMLLQKEKEQRKTEKKARLEEREKKALSKLMENYNSKET